MDFYDLMIVLLGIIFTVFIKNSFGVMFFIENMFSIKPTGEKDFIESIYKENITFRISVLISFYQTIAFCVGIGYLVDILNLDIEIKGWFFSFVIVFSSVFPTLVAVNYFRILRPILIIKMKKNDLL